MSERLRQFVLGMATDLERAKRFSADPHSELAQTDLSPEERDIILRRDPDVLREAAGMPLNDPLSLELFFEKPPAKPATPGKPRKPATRPPAKRTPAKKAPAKKAPAKKAPAKKGSAKRPAVAKRGARKTARKSTRKGTGRRR